MLVLSALNASGLIPYAHFTINYRVFLYGLGLAVFFGLLSGRLPRLAHVAAAPGAGPEGSVAMIRHLLQAGLEPQARRISLIAVEILLSFLVLAAVTTLRVFYVDNYRQPLGYMWQDTWVVSLDTNSQDVLCLRRPETNRAGQRPASGRQRAQVARFLGIVRDLPEVESVSAAFLAPYGDTTWTEHIKVRGRTTTVLLQRDATDDFAGPQDERHAGSLVRQGRRWRGLAGRRHQPAPRAGDVRRRGPRREDSSRTRPSPIRGRPRQPTDAPAHRRA